LTLLPLVVSLVENDKGKLFVQNVNDIIFPTTIVDQVLSSGRGYIMVIESLGGSHSVAWAYTEHPML
jgi:hypothetical protein